MRKIRWTEGRFEQLKSPSRYVMYNKGLFTISLVMQ
jgi:hypothetical protein